MWTFCKCSTSQHALGHAFVKMMGWRKGTGQRPYQVSLCSPELFGQVVFTDSPELKEQLFSHKDRTYRPVWEGPGPSGLGDLSGAKWAQCLEFTRESRGLF